MKVLKRGRRMKATGAFLSVSLVVLTLAACTESSGATSSTHGATARPEERIFPKLADKITAGALLDPEFSSRTDREPLRAVSQAGLDALKVYEGEVLCEPVTDASLHCPYDDSSDFCTIGHGHLIDKASCASLIPQLTEAGFLDGISEAEAQDLLKRDLASSQLSLERHMAIEADAPADAMLGKVGLTETQYDALVSFIFNVGGGGFSASTLLRVLRDREALGDSSEVARQFTRWTKSAGNHVPGLLNRRNKEVDQFFIGFERPLTARGADEGDAIDIRDGEQVVK